MNDMGHLTSDELVDLVDGATKAADFPHLATCGSCRQQLVDLRTTMTTASNVEVPEPSPLFWNQFSSRVREAVANEAAPRAGWWQRVSSWPGVMAPVSAVTAAAIVLLVMISAPPTVAPPPVGPVARIDPMSSSSTLELLSDSGGYDDASLELVAELTDSLGWDGAADAGLAPDGSAEHAVTHLSVGELQQLQHLLQAELAGKGA
jgi:hypothetical protein